MHNPFPRRPGRFTPRTFAPIAAVCWLAFGPQGTGHAAPVVRQDQPGAEALTDEEEEEREYRLALARQSFELNCLICHDAGMITSQRLTPAQWSAEVEKMIGWGSPVPPEEVVGLVEFLATSYPAELPRDPPDRVSPSIALEWNRPEPGISVLPEGDVARGAALHTEHCATCHGENALGADLGPNLVNLPVLRREPDYAEVVREGRRRMPGFRLVLSPQQEADILEWLKGQRYEGFGE